MSTILATSVRSFSAAGCLSGEPRLFGGLSALDNGLAVGSIVEGDHS